MQSKRLRFARLKENNLMNSRHEYSQILMCADTANAVVFPERVLKENGSYYRNVIYPNMILLSMYLNNKIDKSVTCPNRADH